MITKWLYMVLFKIISRSTQTKTSFIEDSRYSSVVYFAWNFFLAFFLPVFNMQNSLTRFSSHFAQCDVRDDSRYADNVTMTLMTAWCWRADCAKRLKIWVWESCILKTGWREGHYKNFVQEYVWMHVCRHFMTRTTLARILESTLDGRWHGGITTSGPLIASWLSLALTSLHLCFIESFQTDNSHRRWCRYLQLPLF